MIHSILGKLTLCGAVVLAFGAVDALAAESVTGTAPGTAQVERLKSFREGDIFTAEVQIKGDLVSPEAQVHFINETVQVDFPGATLAKGKLLSRVDDRLVKSVYVYAPDASAVRARVLLKPGFVARSLESQVKVVRRGTNITVEITGDAQKGNAKAEQEVSRAVAILNADELGDDGSGLATRLVADPNIAQPAVELNPGGADPTTAGTEMEAQAVVLPSKEVLNKLPESQIPVLANAKSEKKEAGSGWTRLMITLGVLTVVLGAASFGVKKWAAKSNKTNQNTRIKILTQHHLGPKKSLAIVQVAGESILIGMTDQNISMLKTLSLLDEEIPEEVPSNFNNAMADFVDEDDDDAFDKAPKSKRGRKQRREPEDFAMRGLAEIRDVVSSRLKSFKNLDE